ncbi:unnamed protein product [Didymodactylos carnosus]|uniref:F-box domain-containing protein n=1 Tax=Didymodactylos carnosus TaxID=1234261 RepID=A0A8S2JSR4_9BILA|nr:unnamed protein product [Didymodactylos carnosus]CAF3821113.1 unnamed protein product [Didymodactylos carnosus]
MTTEIQVLPDEIFLTICRYMSSTDVLKSFYNLNTRYNCTLTEYRQNVDLSKTSYNDFIYLCCIILPSLASQIISLRLDNQYAGSQLKLFDGYFRSKYQIFVKLKSLKLVNCSTDELKLFIGKMKKLKSLIELDIISNDLYETEFLTNFLFSKQHHIEKLSIKPHFSSQTYSSMNFIYPTNTNLHWFDINYFYLWSCPCVTLTNLTISLKSFFNIHVLLDILPNIKYLKVCTVCKSADEKCDKSLFSNSLLTTFCLKLSADYPLLFEMDNLEELLSYLPMVMSLSLDLFVKDDSFIDSERWQSFLSSKLKHLTTFNLSVHLNCIQNINSIHFNRLLEPYSINYWVKEKKWFFCCRRYYYGFHLFTIPYAFKKLDMGRQRNWDENTGEKQNCPLFTTNSTSECYSKVHDLIIDECTTSSISSFLSLIVQFYNVRYLGLCDGDFNTLDAYTGNMKLLKLTKISYTGCYNKSLLKELLNISPNIRELVMGFDDFKEFIDDVTSNNDKHIIRLLECIQTLELYLIFPCYIDDSNFDKFDLKEVLDMLPNVKYLFFDMCGVETHKGNLLPFIITEAKQLICIKCLNVEKTISKRFKRDPKLWLMDYTSLRNKQESQFHVDYDEKHLSICGWKKKIEHEHYAKALEIVFITGTVILKRASSERWVDNYNEKCVRNWQANLDVQYVMNAYACEKYGEVCVQEAIYRVSSRRLKESRRKVEFIPTDRDCFRLAKPMSYLKKLVEEGKDENADIICSNFVDKYFDIPDDPVFDICLADFVSKYRIINKKSVNPKSRMKTWFLKALDFGIRARIEKPAVI